MCKNGTPKIEVPFVPISLIARCLKGGTLLYPDLPFQFCKTSVPVHGIPKPYKHNLQKIVHYWCGGVGEDKCGGLVTAVLVRCWFMLNIIQIRDSGMTHMK